MLGNVYVERDAGCLAKSHAELDRAFDEVCEKKAALVVHSLITVVRSIPNAVKVINRLVEAGASLVAISDKIDTATKEGRMVARLLAVVARIGNELKSENQRTAIADRMRDGVFIGRVRYGNMVSEDGKHLVRNLAERRVIARILKERRAGRTLRQVAAGLNADGFVTKRGCLWRLQQIRLVLRYHKVDRSINRWKAPAKGDEDERSC